MANLKISQLIELAESDGTEYTEVIVTPFTPGTNRKIRTSKLGGITRESNRAWTSVLIFDKNEIKYQAKTLTEGITFTIADEGNLINASSVQWHVITTNGSHAINFEGFFQLTGITNGEVKPAGTYVMYIAYWDGEAVVSWLEPSSQVSNALVLASPGSFSAVANGENQIDLSWTDVANESSYLIEKSETGNPDTWVELATPAAGSTSASDTGLSAGETVFYRIRAVGDGENFLSSPFVEASAMTETSGDVTAPTFTFSPTNGSSTWAVNRPIVITATEGIRDQDGSEITDANIDDYITLKETDSSGTNILFTATIDVTKTIITITPTTLYGASQLVYVAIDGVEDVNGNHSTLASITFTTTDYTLFDCTSNRVVFFDLLDSMFTAADAKFQLEITLKNPSIVGNHFLPSRYSTSDNQRQFFWSTAGTDVYFSYYPLTGDNVNHRRVTFNNCLTTNDDVDQVFVLQYDGAIDTDNGGDRPTMTRNGVPVSGILIQEWGTLGDLFASTAQLSFGMGVSDGGVPTATSFYCGEAKDFIVKSGVADTVELNVPVLITGEDTSGNNNDGTWV